MTEGRFFFLHTRRVHLIKSYLFATTQKQKNFNRKKHIFIEKCCPVLHVPTYLDQVTNITLSLQLWLISTVNLPLKGGSVVDPGTLQLAYQSVFGQDTEPQTTHDVGV